jgi:isocitrate dehydrogenase (NAD+)
MLRHLGEAVAADAVESAVRSVIAEGQTVTYDLGGTAGTREFGEAVAARLR